MITGEIGNSDENAINADSIVLVNRDEEESGGEAKPVILSESLVNFSLFEGEIVCLEGTAEQKKLIAEKIIKPKPMAKIEYEPHENVHSICLTDQIVE